MLYISTLAQNKTIWTANNHHQRQQQEITWWSPPLGSKWSKMIICKEKGSDKACCKQDRKKSRKMATMDTGRSTIRNYWESHHNIDWRKLHKEASAWKGIKGLRGILQMKWAGKWPKRSKTDTGTSPSNKSFCQSQLFPPQLGKRGGI